MKNKKLLTNILFAVVVLAIAAVLLAVRSHNATGGKLTAQLIYGDANACWTFRWKRTRLTVWTPVIIRCI